MAQRLKPVDVVTIGVGLTGSLAALELAKEGLTIVGLERGASRYSSRLRSTTNCASRFARR
jgi:gluconate 2-dehydrogenase alpha chain